LKIAKPGDWNIVIIDNLSITRITDVETDFYYYSQNDTWALWHAASPLTPFVLHLAIYNGNGSKSSNAANSNTSTKGSAVTPETAAVIASIV
jgi:hypothetical protein